MPIVWRQLQAPATLRLDDLHHAIQILMGWSDRHLHLFEIAGREYGPRPESEWTKDDEPHLGAWAGESSALTVAEALARGDGTFDYVYDLGDDWRIAITSSPGETATHERRPECLAGEGASPPEDCGGPAAYQRGQDERGVRPTTFDLHGVNARLALAFRSTATPDHPAGRTADARAQLLAEITLAMLFLASRENRHDQRAAPKTLKDDVLENLQDAGFLYTDPQRKSVILTGEGLARARDVVARIAPVLGRRLD